MDVAGHSPRSLQRPHLVSGLDEVHALVGTVAHEDRRLPRDAVAEFDDRAVAVVPLPVRSTPRHPGLGLLVDHLVRLGHERPSQLGERRAQDQCPVAGEAAGEAVGVPDRIPALTATC